MLKKIKRKVKSVLHPEHVVDYMDAPILRGEEACIPTGDSVAITPNFRSLRENEPIVAEHLGEATVTGRHGWIRQRGIWMMQFSWYGGQTFLPPSYQDVLNVPYDIERSEQLEGKVFTTVPCFNWIYGHVLLDELPLLLHLLEEERFKDCDTVLCSSLAKRLMTRVTHPDRDRLQEMMRPADMQTLYKVSSLSALRRNGCKMNPSETELGLLRDAAGLQETIPDMPRRIFLVRSSETRRIENISEVRHVLKQYDVAEVDASKHPAPWLLFGNADLVSGVAGSDLSDSAFMSPGATLIEIHPSDHLKPYNWNVANTLKLTYHSMIATSQVMRNTPTGTGNSSIHIDPTILTTALDAALQET